MHVSRQVWRYILVGLGSNAILYLGYLGLTGLGVGHKLAATGLYVIGTFHTFFINRSWTFKHAGNMRNSLLRYWIAYACGYVANILLLALLVDVAGYPHEIVQGILILVVALTLFVLQKYWVFASAQPASRHRTVRSAQP
jgi:putative flippase GtrA